MAIIGTLNKQSDFTGEVPLNFGGSGLWRFNESSPDSDHNVMDSSENNRSMYIENWEGTTCTLTGGKTGRYLRMNISSPTTEKTHLEVSNDGSIFSNIGEKICVGGWMNPTTYSVGNTFCPIFNTRQGPGQPILYLSLYQGRPRLMLYNSSGSLILDSSVTMPFSLVNNGWYFISAIIEVNDKKATYFVADRSSGEIFVSDVMTFTGDLNVGCTADLIMGMHAETYYYAGGFDDWFLDVDSSITTADLTKYFLGSLSANGGDSTASVDAITTADVVTLKLSDGSYPSTGQLVTIPTNLNLSGDGRISISSEYTAGLTEISLVETSTSNDLITWSDWESLGDNGTLISPNALYIRFRVTLSTSDSRLTPKLKEITVNDIPKQSTEHLGFANLIILNSNEEVECILENSFDVIITSEVNGADTLSFKLPFMDSKREYIQNENLVKISNEIYSIRTITDEKDTDGNTITTVYAESSFYDLAFSIKKDTKEFNADTADIPLAYALEGTSWEVGTVDVTSLRTWESSGNNALTILRETQSMHSGDLIFDCVGKLVHLLSFSGSESGALFTYRKNMKSIQRVVDTRELITKLYVYGKDGLTFSSINGGNDYVENYDFTEEVRISTLDCSSFTNPYQMLEYAEEKIEEYANPRVSYVISAMDLSVLTGYEHESWNLGDIVIVEDKELGIFIKTRVIRREYNVREPWNTVLELSTTLRELGDTSAQWDNAADVLSSTDVIDRQEVKDLVPFNLLRNSRADSGLSYWTNSGFEVDGENGASGTASFKASGVLDMTKSISQKVTPSNRSNYTISAQIASENLEKGDSGQVGIEVTFEYEDGSTEIRFIDLF